MDLVVILLLVIIFLKLVAISNAIKCIKDKGLRLVATLTSRKSFDEDDRDRLLDAAQANFFPFGLKDYMLRRYLRDMKLKMELLNFRTKSKFWIFTLFQKILFQFQGIALVSVLIMIGTASHAFLVALPRSAYNYCVFALAVLLLVGIILLAFEAIVSTITLGSYGFAFHGLDLKRRPIFRPDSADAERQYSAHTALLELYSFGGTLLVAYIIYSCASYFVSVSLGGFSSLNGPASGFIDADRLFKAFYYSLLVEGGGASPVSFPARLLTYLAIIPAIVLLVAVIATVLTAIAPSIVSARSGGVDLGDPSGSVDVSCCESIETDATDSGQVAEQSDAPVVPEDNENANLSASESDDGGDATVNEGPLRDIQENQATSGNSEGEQHNMPPEDLSPT